MVSSNENDYHLKPLKPGVKRKVVIVLIKSCYFSMINVSNLKVNNK